MNDDAYLAYLRTLAAMAEVATYPPGYVAFLRELAARAPKEPARTRIARLDYFRELGGLARRLVDVQLRDSRAHEAALADFRALILKQPDRLRHRLLGSNLARLRRLSASERLMIGVLEVEPDLLGPMGRLRAEVTVSTLLAYHIDPSRSPALAPVLLRAFLELAGAEPEVLDGNMSAAFVRAEAFTPQGRVDVRIETDALLVYVEVKIDAAEGEGQLERYRAALRRESGRLGKDKLLVYLTLDDRRTGRGTDGIVHVIWRDLLRAWLPYAAPTGGAAGYLGRYLKSIARLVECAAPGTFADWDFFHQRQALALVTDSEETEA